MLHSEGFQESKRQPKKYKEINIEKFWEKVVDPALDNMTEHTTAVIENCTKNSKKNNEAEIRAAHDCLFEQKAEIAIQNYMGECESESDDNDQQLYNGEE